MAPSVHSRRFATENGREVFKCPSLECGGVAPALGGILNESTNALDAQASRHVESKNVAETVYPTYQWGEKFYDLT